MYVEDSRVEAPEPGVPIWRYIDFAKFVDMLERRALHFSSMNALGDPFEGMPSEATIDQNREWSKQAREHAIATGFAPPTPNGLRTIFGRSIEGLVC